MTALSAGFTASDRRTAASTSSDGDASPRRTSSAWAVASSPASSSVMSRGQGAGSGRPQDVQLGHVVVHDAPLRALVESGDLGEVVEG